MNFTCVAADERDHNRGEIRGTNITLERSEKEKREMGEEMEGRNWIEKT